MVARRVLDGIAALPAVAGRTVTVSAGVARFPVDGADSEALIAAATAALARAKAAGPGSVAEQGRRRREPVRPRRLSPRGRRAGRDDRPVGAVAPGAGSRVRARTIPGSVGSPSLSKRGRPGGADREAAERRPARRRRR